ncbi:DMT family transporter [Tuberibacillus sp. Marseille-P3662]|uniref:DMT family transporter n=1 Tax=Tuberibacillus sp. Marseille-P3662 TaxID=1965358 RepID=UPI000A1CA46D|nr:DMT family transporter [Tuberibacillus sp. Marseille-P3662]
MNIYIAYGLIVMGASFWGVTGLFVQYLYEFGLTPWDVVTIRMSVSSAILLLILSILGRDYLKVQIKHLPYFFGLGVFCIAFFNWCYFAVMERTSLSVAVIFVYTSPIFAAIIARFFYRETITFKKCVAMGLTIIGCGLVAGIISSGGTSLSGMTVLLGLLSGLFCSLYSVLGRYVSQIYHPVTITIYSMICGSVLMIPTSSIWTKSSIFMNGDVWIYIFGISIISTIFAYTLYTLGLTYIESSKATILSTVELVVSVMIGVLVFNDGLTGWQWIGFLLVFSSLFITVIPNKKRPKVHHSLNYKPQMKSYY